MIVFVINASVNGRFGQLAVTRHGGIEIKDRCYCLLLEKVGRSRSVELVFKGDDEVFGLADTN
ncbi:MAG TPA: hypothetical protein DCY55_10500 [Gammaproteobacteria bacterium]|nr:hypothetical protein [Gammaproteobacteria bacterium]